MNLAPTCVFSSSLTSPDRTPASTNFHFAHTLHSFYTSPPATSSSEKHHQHPSRRVRYLISKIQADFTLSTGLLIEEAGKLTPACWIVLRKWRPKNQQHRFQGDPGHADFAITSPQSSAQGAGRARNVTTNCHMWLVLRHMGRRVLPKVIDCTRKGFASRVPVAKESIGAVGSNVSRPHAIGSESVCTAQRYLHTRF